MMNMQKGKVPQCAMASSASVLFLGCKAITCTSISLSSLAFKLFTRAAKSPVDGHVSLICIMHCS